MPQKVGGRRIHRFGRDNVFARFNQSQNRRGNRRHSRSESQRIFAVFELGDGFFQRRLRRISQSPVKVTFFLIIMNRRAFVGIGEGENRSGVNRDAYCAVIFRPVFARVNSFGKKRFLLHQSLQISNKIFC